MASAPETMIVYRPSGDKRHRIEEGKVVGRLGYSHGWTLWANFTSKEKPGEVAFGCGCRGKSDDMPKEEEVEVMCIIWHDSGCRLSVVRREDGSLVPAGFMRQAGSLAWPVLTYTPASALMPSPTMIEQLLLYVELSPQQVNRRRGARRVAAGVGRIKGTSDRTRLKKRKQGAVTNDLNLQADCESTSGDVASLAAFNNQLPQGGEMQEIQVAQEILHPPPHVVHTTCVEETRTAHGPPQQLVDLAVLSSLAERMAAEVPEPEVETPEEEMEELEEVEPPQTSSSQPEEEEEESRFKPTMISGVRLARNVVPRGMCKELAAEIAKIDQGE